MEPESREGIRGRDILGIKQSAWTPRRILAFILGVGMALFHVYAAGVRPLPGIQQRAIHLSLALALTFLLFPLKTHGDDEGRSIDDRRPLSVIDLVLVLLSLAIGTYVFFDYEGLSFRMGDPTGLDILCGVVAILLVLETTRRTIGNVMVVICMAGFAYLAFGESLPSYLAHTGVTFEKVVNYMYPSTEGILGVAMDVSATVIVVFIIFGAFLEGSGAGSLFMDTGMALFGKYRGGPAKACILGSCLFGMITGSQVANVAAVGVLTIPLMMKAGYRPEVAAAIESIGSTGSMIMPPVMGAAAFVIPEIIGGTYWDVVKAAFVPALLYYLTLYMVVELQAVKYGLRGVPKAELPRFRIFVREKGHMILPLAVLVYFLAFRFSTPGRAAFWAIVASVLASQLRSKTSMGTRQIMHSLEKGARATLVVAICCASAGIVTGVLGITGMGLRFSDVLVTLAGGSPVVLLIFTMVASLIIGLPLPPFTCYIILAVLAAPALIKMGIHPMAAHLFVFFFGTLGNISPPVAPVSFAAAGVAGCNPVKTTNLAFLYCIPSFFVPYLFVYRTELLLVGSAAAIAYEILSASIGIICVTIVIQGYLFRSLTWFERLVFLAGGLLLVYPHWIADIAGYSLVGLIVLIHFLRVRTILNKASLEST